jgi:hypothetical protein
MSIIVWFFIVLVALVGIYAFIRWNNRPVEWKPGEVADLLQSWLDDDVDDASWDYFEACEISNPKLEEVRQRALDAIYVESPYMDAGQHRLNEVGRALFRELKAKCISSLAR